MKAVIMAGGEGTRLRPLTCDCPKPMMRLMGRPVMEYAAALLRRHGITDIAATLGYLPDAVTDHFGDGSVFGVSIRYFVEATPMGTAGGVGQARDFLDETFIVLSGDGVTDLDITDALAFHRRKKALATIILKAVDAPFEYGVVMTGDDQRVTGFIEKPDPSNVFSPLVNTGIYILEPEIFARIPEGQPYDFGSQLFPALAAEGLPVYGYSMSGYWCDIGDVDAYIAAHIHAMEGRIDLPGLKDSGGFQDARAHIDPSAVIEQPCCICEGAVIGKNARIGPGSVIGPGCTVSENAGIKRSILWQDAYLAPGAQARGCVLAAAARMETGAQAYESCVIGTGAVLSERSVLEPGVRLWPGKQTDPGHRVAENLVWGGNRRAGFRFGALPVSRPASVMHAAQALASALSPKTLLIGRTDHPMANVMWHAAAAGAMAQGVQVADAGVCPLPVLRHAAEIMGCDASAQVTEDGFIPLESTGARLLSKRQRTVLALLARQDFARPRREGLLPVIPAENTVLMYTAHAAKRFAADPGKSPAIRLYCPDAQLAAIAEEALSRAGLAVRPGQNGRGGVPKPGELGLMLDRSGERFALSDSEGPLTEAQSQLFIAWTALCSGEKTLCLPMSATRSIRHLAEDFGANVEFVGSEPLMWQAKLAEKYPFQFILHHDGLQAALTGLSHLAEQGMTLGGWRFRMPHTCRRKRRVESHVPAGQVLEAFARDMPGASLDCGVRFDLNGGWAWVCPEEDRASFRIVTESASAETASELCDLCVRKIEKMIQK